ncbi:MAG: sspA [Gammaproteobacteria bacterium]|nr:sspA [Gammaproteobacteria bacterium]
MATVAKRSTMTLYSTGVCPYSHQVRIVMIEKGLTPEIIEVNLQDKPEDLLTLNPYGQVPTLVDRDLIVYESRIIMEYLDERFPHPPLLPVYPVARARARLMMLRIERDWYSLMGKIMKNAPELEQARNELMDGLVSVAPVFAEMPYFMSEEFSLIDCCLAPMLWRLPKLGIELPAQAKAIEDYMKRIFKRKTFKASLTETEREMRL